MKELKIEELCAPSVKWLVDECVNEDMCVVGAGPSLIGFDFQRLRKYHTICVNDAIFPCREFATFHIFSDEAIYQRYVGLAYSPETTVVTQHEAAKQLILHNPVLTANKNVRVFVRPSLKRIGLSDIKRDDYYLWIHRTTATGAIMLAWKLGARNVFMLGVDGYRLPDGTYYYDGSQKKDLKQTPVMEKGTVVELVEPHRAWREDMNELKGYLETYAANFHVYNLSALSTIDAWPKKPVDEVL